MIAITTSRDPSQRTRSFCKVIARFMNWNYIQRGKSPFREMVKAYPEVIVVREIKGNPAFMDFFRNGKRRAMIRINVGVIRKEKMDDSPVYFAGRVPFDPLMFGAIPKDHAGEKFALKIKPKKVVYSKRGRELDFRYDGRQILTVKVVGVHEGENRDQGKRGVA